MCNTNRASGAQYGSLQENRKKKGAHVIHQQMKEPATKSDNLSSIPKTYMVERESTPAVVL